MLNKIGVFVKKFMSFFDPELLVFLWVIYSGVFSFSPLIYDPLKKLIFLLELKLRSGGYYASASP
jgi:hypothetical protein